MLAELVIYLIFPESKLWCSEILLSLCGELCVVILIELCKDMRGKKHYT